DILGIALLELYQFLSGSVSCLAAGHVSSPRGPVSFLHVMLGSGSYIGELVQLFQSADRSLRFLIRSLLREILPSPDNQSELRSPVANVIIGNHFVPEKFSDARQRVAEHSAADVTDMHRLRHIRRSEINDDASR